MLRPASVLSFVMACAAEPAEPVGFGLAPETLALLPAVLLDIGESYGRKNCAAGARWRELLSGSTGS